MDTQDKTLDNKAVNEEKTIEPATEPVVEPTTEPTAEPTAEADGQTAAEEALPQTVVTEQTTEQEQPAEQPVEEEAEQPAEEVAEQPAEEAAEQPAEEAAEQPAEEAAEQPAEKVVVRTYNTKQEVITRLKELAHGEQTPTKDETEQLKTAYYKLHTAEREAALKAYIDEGGDPEKYRILPDPDEEVFKAEMAVIKERRFKLFQEQEAQKQENLKTKLEIIEKIKAMATSPEEANKSYQEFKKLQQQWREIKLIPAEKSGELWRNYHLYVEQFYDLLKLNSQAREYDFRKNLERKTLLCEAAEKLTEETDVISAFHQLQKLHQEYREIGPVAKEIREEIWARFKAASTAINKRHQQHFENLRAHENENLQKKTALCERAEAVAAEENKGAADWERHTKEMIALQNEWKTIGFAPQKMNVKIFERFRTTCDDFFKRKSEHFRSQRERFAENAEKKRALVAQAQALQDSTDWKATGDKLIELQKEWKTIGRVPRKQGDQLWNDFLAACNKFFSARNAATSDTRSSERDNLKQKRSIVARLKALVEENPDDVQQQAQQLNDEYNAIGHVPYRDKDKLFKEYREATDMLYRECGVRLRQSRSDGGQKYTTASAAANDESERSRLMRRYETLKQEVQTYENNLGFLSVSSKKGSSLIDEMNKKVQKLKDDMQAVKDKINAIDAETKDDEVTE